MTEFKVGELVRIKRLVSEDCMSGASIGDLAEIISGFDGQHYLVNYGGTCGYITPGSIEPYIPRNTDSRLTEAEAKIAALEAEVSSIESRLAILNAPLKKRKESANLYIRPVAKTPNQRRADVIKRAQAFVVDLERRAIIRTSNTDGNKTFNHKRSKLEFHVSAEKRGVTALSTLLGEGQVHDVVTVKCHPNDVFNADIGKAIAAGKLYGVDIPQEFVDAPVPTEIVVGMRVRSTKDWLTAVNGPFLVGDTFDVKGKHDVAKYECEINSGKARNSVIIEDTDAKYS